jgi:hypothetical protein
VDAATTTITMNGDYAIVANFEELPQYNLTISSTDGGSVTDPGEGTFPYPGGTVVNLSAEAEAGYRFVNWTGDVGTIANVDAATTTITMNGDYAIVANFEEVPQQYNLTTSSTAGGSVTTPGEGTFPYDEGTVANLVATPDAGYRFVNWTGDVGTIANVDAATTTITMNGDYVIVANFEEIVEVQFNLSLSMGWTLISIPFVPVNLSLDAIFPNASDGDELYTYNGGWSTTTYYAALPGWYGDFDTIELDKGYWYNANAAYTATIMGTEAGARSVPIAAGWNLIGYTKLTDTALDTLIPNASNGDELYAYNGGWSTTTYYAALPGWYGDFSTMQSGKGYWYNANSPFTWAY